jgi:hypothetical protein
MVVVKVTWLNHYLPKRLLAEPAEQDKIPTLLLPSTLPKFRRGG